MYTRAIACTATGRAVTLGTTDGDSPGAPPLLAALDRPDHAGLLTREGRALLARWLASGARYTDGSLHPAGFSDPRSPASHGALLRGRRYRPMIDPEDADACGTCHEGAPRRPAITTSAPGAPACATCHREPAGALGCGTCHGEGEPGRAHAHPPRDRCFHPEANAETTHAAHVRTLACATCHPTPAPGRLDGTHTNGLTELWFDYALAGPAARFDAGAKRCSGTCHDRGGARPTPAWTETAPMGCGDCHGAPPKGHYAGACTSCHREADATGTALVQRVLHGNGKVDLGDGSGRCGACHGSGDDPWPATGAHRAHANPGSSRPVACETCHELPQGNHPRGTGAATVTLRGLATKGGRLATFDATTKTCASTYCHEGRGGVATTPRWTDGAGLGCTSCHGQPPAPPHTQNVTSCAGASCHDGITAGPSAIADQARPFHVDGLITRRVP